MFYAVHFMSIIFIDILIVILPLQMGELGLRELINCPRAGQLTPDGTCHLRPSPGIRSEPFYLSLTATAFGIVYFLSVLVIFFLPCCRMKCGLNTSIKQDDQDALREKHEEGSF